MAYIHWVFGPPTKRNLSAIVTVSVLSTAVIFNLVRLVFYDKQDKIIKSPTATLLPNLSASEIAVLPYPPDALPGGRNVNSPVSPRPPPSSSRVFVDMNH